MTEPTEQPEPTKRRNGLQPDGTVLLDAHLDRVVELKLLGVKDRDIAAELDVNHATVSRYVRRPKVSKEIDRAHGELMKRASRQLAFGAEWAVEALLYFVNPANRESIKPQYQLQAAKIMMDTIGLGRVADAGELLGASIIETAAESGRAKVAAIEASFEAVELKAVNE